MIIFHNLDRDQIQAIVDIQLNNLRKVVARKKIGVSFDKRAKEYLAERGYDPVFGARPLKRVIQKEIVDALAMKLLDGGVSEGDFVTVTTDRKGGLTITRSEEASSESVA
jgi:ATP-dependent Clp protease ATP-binding subunit ClpB